jgi:thymidylate kinase
MSNLILFEGLPGSGKTTLVELIKKSLGDQALICPKLDVYSVIVQGLKYEYPLYGKVSEKVAFLLEQIRDEIIDGMDSTPKFILCERSYWSILAYNYVLSKNNYPNLYAEVMQYYRHKTYRYPDTFIYLKHPPYSSIERNAHTYTAFYKDIHNLKYIEEFYDANLIGKSNVVTIDALMPLDNVVKQIMNILTDM